MANRNFSNSRIYTMHVMPVLVDCNFIVDSTDADGLGIRSLKGPLVDSVLMATSAATPAADNPNPADGTIIVRLQDNYNRLYSCYPSIISPNSGSDIKIDNSALTPGVAYTITTLGDATTAKWQAIGVPVGVTPAVGVTFIAANAGTGSNALTSRVQTSAAAGSGVATIELVGNPNVTTINPAPSANQGYGAEFILQCRDYAGALVAPADGSIISLAFYLSNSSITVAGE